MAVLMPVTSTAGVTLPDATGTLVLPAPAPAPVPMASLLKTLALVPMASPLLTVASVLLPAKVNVLDMMALAATAVKVRLHSQLHYKTFC